MTTPKVTFNTWKFVIIPIVISLAILDGWKVLIFYYAGAVIGLLLERESNE